MFQIITDGSCDLGAEIVQEQNLLVVPFYVSIDGETYKKEIEEMPIREFYQFMVDHPDQFPKSSLPCVQDYVNVFEPLAKEGKDILCICITTKFSGSYNSAMNAKELVLEDYPDVKIEVVDATVNTVLQGLLVQEAARLQREGKSFEETLARVEEIKSTGRIFFTVGSMDYLIHGGRVGKLAGVAAGKLGIKPLILLKEGEIFPNGLSRRRDKSKEKVIAQCVQYMKEQGYTTKDCSFAIGYGYDIEEGETFRQQLVESLKQAFPDEEPVVQTHQIGATISVHTGPYPIGIGIIQKA